MDAKGREEHLKALIVEFMRVHHAAPAVVWPGTTGGCACVACAKARVVGFEAPQLREAQVVLLEKERSDAQMAYLAEDALLTRLLDYIGVSSVDEAIVAVDGLRASGPKGGGA